jgi:hypothetical protein
MDAYTFANRMAAHNQAIQKDLSAFLAAEVNFIGANNLNLNTEHTAKLTAYDIMYKKLWLEHATDKREASAALGEQQGAAAWQASDLIVYTHAPASTAVLKLDDYKQTLSRTSRIDEDRKGFTPLSEKKAFEMGYVTQKAASL